MTTASKHLPAQIGVITAARTVLNTMWRMVYPFLPVFSRALGVDLAAMAALMTVRSVLGVGAPFLSALAGGRSRRFAMLAALLLFIVGMGVMVVRPGFWSFAVALVLAALAKFIYDPAMQAYVGDRVPYQRRGLALALTEMSWSLSFVLGVPLMGFLIARFGYRAPFPLLGILALVGLAGLYAVTPPEEPGAEAQAGLKRSLQTVLTFSPALAGLAMCALTNAANEVVNLVFGVWMEDSFGLQIAALGAASAVIGLAELGGESLVGGLADRLGKPRAVGIGLAANCLASLALPLVGRTLPGAFVALFFFYITYEFTLVSIIPLMTEVMPQSRATLMAATAAGFSLGRAGGAFLAPGLYHIGIFASTGMAVLLNLLALAALLRLEKGIRHAIKEPAQK